MYSRSNSTNCGMYCFAPGPKHPAASFTMFVGTSASRARSARVGPVLVSAAAVVQASSAAVASIMILDMVFAVPL